MPRKVNRSSTEKKPVDEAERAKRSAASKKAAATKRRNKEALQSASCSHTSQARLSRPQRNCRKTQSTEDPYPSAAVPSKSCASPANNVDGHNAAPGNPRPAGIYRHILPAPASSQNPLSAKDTASLDDALARTQQRIGPLPPTSNSSQSQKVASNNSNSQSGAQSIASSLHTPGSLAPQAGLPQTIQPIPSVVAPSSCRIQSDVQRSVDDELQARERNADFSVHKDTFEMPENLFESDWVVVQSIRNEELKWLHDMRNTK